MNFDKDGFLPPHNCKKCNNPLQGQGEGRPAELYAGTYTGLCYNCQNSGDLIVLTEKDGARHISTPPSCPSWRRDRESYVGYADCLECKGVGYKWKSGRHDSYRAYCEPCLKRHSNHPSRVKYHQLAKKLYNKYNGIFQKRIKEEQKKSGIKELNKETQAKLSEDLWLTYSKNIRRLNKVLDKMTL